jgi:hypothetical protein
LARLEAGIVFTTLPRRLLKLQLAVGRVEYRENYLRGLKTLPLVFEGHGRLVPEGSIRV